MATVKPSIRPTETYTEPNFLRVYTAGRAEARSERLATIEHLSYSAAGGKSRSGWSCTTIVDGDGSDGVAVVQTYLRRTRGMEAPVLVLRGGNRVLKADENGEVGLFDTYREEFEVAWADSRPVS